jgi:hypothetical protein
VLGIKVNKSARGYAQGLVIALIASLLVLVPSFQPPSLASGTLTPNDGTCDLIPSSGVYLITDSDDLYESADCATNSSVVFELVDDIALDASASQEPIGFSSSTTSSVFSGTLDGKNFSVTGINISTSNATNFNSGGTNNGVGLFWGLGDATIKNITFSGSVYSGFGPTGGLVGSASATITLSEVNLQIEVTADSDDHVAGFAGYLGGSSVVAIISSSHTATVSIKATGDRTGGFVGEADIPSSLSFVSSTNSAHISGDDEIGGFVGEAAYVIFSNSKNLGVVTGTEYVGGFVGRVNNSMTVSASLNNAQISGISGQVGGFLGRTSGTIFVNSSTNSGVISATGGSAVGGFAGRVASAFITESANMGNISAPAGGRTGGLVGDSDVEVVVVDSSNTGTIEADGISVGGLVGEAEAITIQQSANSGTVSAVSDQVGGLVGFAHAAVTIQQSANSGAVSAGTQVAGGLVGGANAAVTIQQSANSGNVSAGTVIVGGLIGGAVAAVTIQQSTNSGAVSAGTDIVGGLVGIADGPLNVEKSTNTGGVAGSDWVGGIVGSVLGNAFATISQTLVSGTITGSSEVGGIVGYLANPNTEILDSLVLSRIVSTGGLTGGFLGDTGAIQAAATFSNVLFAGSFDVPTRSEIGAIYGGDGIDGQSFASSSYWALDANSDLNAAAPAAAFTSSATSFLNTEASRTAASYIGWDFTSIWGFGGCNVNNGLPILRFAEPSATSATGTCVESQGPSAPTGPTKPYEGPVIQSLSETVAIGQPATVTGIRLNTITEVIVGGQKVSFTISDGVLNFDAPNLAAGTYQLIFVVPISQLNLTATIELLASPTAPSVALGKVNVGSFNGKLVVYALGLDQSRITWKVGGIWGQDFAEGNILNRFDRLTPRRGVTVNVDIFVDGKRQLTKTVLTR